MVGGGGETGDGFEGGGEDSAGGVFVYVRFHLRWGWVGLCGDVYSQKYMALIMEDRPKSSIIVTQILGPLIR